MADVLALGAWVAGVLVAGVLVTAVLVTGRAGVDVAGFATVAVSEALDGDDDVWVTDADPECPVPPPEQLATSVPAASTTRLTRAARALTFEDMEPT